MKNETVHYIGSLSGIEKIEFYLENLKSSPAFSFTVTEREDKISVEISAPQKISENESLGDIQEDLPSRAQKLGIKAPKLVGNLSQDIFNAQKAEEVVLDGKMQLEATPNKKAVSVFVTLYVVLDGDPKVDECIDQYALLRITWLANTLGMKFEKFEKKSIQLH